MFKVAGTGKLRPVQPAHLPLSAGESVLIGLVVAVVVLVPLLGVPAAHFSGMTREGIHALLAVIFGLTVAEIFERFGEPYFRDGERKVIARLLDDRRKDDAVPLVVEDRRALRPSEKFRPRRR